jgi:hypothetical protein
MAAPAEPEHVDVEITADKDPSAPLDLQRYKNKISIEKIEAQVEDIRDLFAVKKLGPENVSQIIVEVIKMVTPLTKLTKEQKSSLATQICNRLIEDIIPGRDAPMETILKAMVPDLIERLVMLDMSKLAKKFCPCMSA